MRFRNFIATLLVLCGITASASAGLLPVNVLVTPQGTEGNNFMWTYQVVIPTDQYLVAGDYFTIYDFEGLIDGTVTVPDSSLWTYQVSNVGKTPGLVTPMDDPNKPNLTFIYTGEPLYGQVGAGNFSANSTMGDRADGVFTSRVHRSSDDKTEDSITFSDIPRPGAPVSNTPEPASVVMFGLGLPVIGLTRWMRRKKA